ncbi:DNA-binding protein [Mycolicibacterium canariasense]|uniref:DNA-binding protein n=1 Tax=Mycolicibacterium canariasense TaxID=228230 RepID=A0A124E1Z5_MYCCR|nr:helix-turn-helix transcriptional regulator [Mycolicibacterium canariasense]MCV7209252.1 helix-turn-helix domain-containing protein [Mycolicibacterium canariasense]ORV05910.1 XRE family transcriptional regulator [Mycolicibacterium canariasense]GAS95220.1 DNA-binding protein [Mycolicibacterium canariasense]
MASPEFGRVVRQWRGRVMPTTVGIALGGRRRATGLRREELAGLAGISVDYLTRLEQGRATSPSAQVVEALARSLRVTDADRALLFRLAGHEPPGLDLVPQRITPSVQRLLDRLAHTPVAVHDATWTLVTANAPYDALMGATTQWRGIERNAVWRHLLGPGSRAVQTADQKAEFHAHLVADLRMTAARYPADPRLKRLIRELTTQSPRFVELWESGAPPVPSDFGKHKVIDHPGVGRITLECDTLIVTAEDLRITMYTAEPDTEDADRLALAIVLGTQVMAD